MVEPFCGGLRDTSPGVFRGVAGVEGLLFEFEGLLFQFEGLLFEFEGLLFEFLLFVVVLVVVVVEVVKVSRFVVVLVVVEACFSWCCVLRPDMFAFSIGCWSRFGCVSPPVDFCSSVKRYFN